MSTRKDHWERVYAERSEIDLSWFEAEPALSLRLIEALAGPEDAILDVGGGASRLVDALLARGYRSLGVLDIAGSALAASQARLGARAAGVHWIEVDVTDWTPDHQVAVWHDRAAFHFLTDATARQAYFRTMADALIPGGHAIVATFAEDGPEICSGLPVQRRSSEDLAAEVAAEVPGAFLPVASERHVHRTPSGAAQRFQVSVFRRV
ncbi:class I SAM-dependent methyltransferase [Roseibacterium sp. SDUM158016]|uniref:class I SAM-dependent methyltransferase n=1 Tax=Roseicyclus sediminis TaxID=2980997 RepID=UPI0021D072D0|nr:class I SAM-dependent methyltransferase [Roseibacterium sp. SDUM158016]MCU4652568.1 class I SAM-dependent methyltransferase [Roseibacterium sp. SDUM158016]